MKKRISMAIAVATAAATMASVSVPVMADDVNITIFNSKMEVQSQFEELAAQYAEEPGVGVEFITIVIQYLLIWLPDILRMLHIQSLW